MHLIIGAKEGWINGFVKQWVNGEIKDWSHETEASHSFLEVDETWKLLLLWLEFKIAQ